MEEDDVAKIAVTGSEGFIGSHLVEALIERGDTVRALVQYNSFSSRGWLEDLPNAMSSEIEVVFGDVRDGGQMINLMDGVDAVCHLAALIAIPYSYAAPASYLATNAGGTLNVLEAVRAHRTPRLVHTSTSEVYGTALTVPIHETHPLQAQSPYSASKIAADKLVESYHLSFAVPAVTVRPFNTYGPRQSARAVIPSVITQIAAGKRQIRLGSDGPTRDFNFVADTVGAFLALLDGPTDVVGRTFNAGSGRGVTIAETVRIIADVMDVEVEVVTDPQRVRPAGSEVHRLVADADALHAVTGWKPQHRLEDGLAVTARWFSRPEHLARYQPDSYQI
jgi:NAD dependent epimerase/dehydratase